MGCILCCNGSKDSKELLTPKQPEYSWDQKKKIDPKDFTIENIENSCSGRLPGSINGEQFIIQNCKNSRIYLLDYIGTITIDDCTHCDIIIGPVKTSIFIRDCSHCNFMVACQQFRTRDCHHLNVFLSCTSQPIIESTTKFKVAPYQLFYPELASQFKSANLSPFNCNWSDVYDFTPVADQGLNFALLPEDARPFKVLTTPSSVLNIENDIGKGDAGFKETDFSKDVSHMEITDVREQSVVPYTYGSRRTVATTEATSVVSLVVIFNNDSQDGLAQDLIKHLSESRSGIFLIKTRETKLSAQVAESLFGQKLHTLAMQGPVISLEYVGSSTVADLVVAFKAEKAAVPNMENLVYSSPDSGRARLQIDLINNVANMGMNSA